MDGMCGAGTKANALFVAPRLTRAWLFFGADVADRDAAEKGGWVYIPSSNAPVRYELTERGVDARLPAGASAAEVIDGFRIEPDLYLDLRAVELGSSTRRGLHSGKKGSVEGRIVVVLLRVKLGHDSISLRASPLGAD